MIKKGWYNHKQFTHLKPDVPNTGILMNAIPIPWTAGLVISTYSYWNSAKKTRTKWVNLKEQRSFCPVYSLRPCLLRAVSVWTIPSNQSRIQMYIPKWCLKWYKAAQTHLCALESHCHTVANVDFLSAVLTTNVSITEFQQAPKTARAPASFSDSEVRIIRWQLFFTHESDKANMPSK